MKNIIEEAKKHNGYLLITYTFVLVLIIMHSNKIGTAITNGINAFSALFVGIGIAYVLNIPMRRIEGFLKKKFKKKTRALSILLTYILALIIIAILLSLIIPQLISTVSNLIDKSEMFEQAYEDVALFIQSRLGIDIPVNISGLIVSLSTSIELILDNLVGSVSSIASGSVTFFVALVVSIYLLASKERLLRQLKKLLASVFRINRGNKVLEFCEKVDGIFTNYVSGLLVDAVVIGSMIALMMVILGLPYAVLIGVITSVLAIIPIFGNVMSMVFGAILIFAVDPIQALYFIIGYQVVQQIENNLIYPRIVGSSVGLPGLWTLLAVSVGGSLFGFLGMLVAVPTASTIYMLLSEFTNGQMKKHEMIIDAGGRFEHDKVVKDKESN